ncbi:MAG: right-handed parallel beta-helix repeat-containing protein [Ilumatobacteraceae bacterium]
MFEQRSSIGVANVIAVLAIVAGACGGVDDVATPDPASNSSDETGSTSEPAPEPASESVDDTEATDVATTAAPTSQADASAATTEPLTDLGDDGIRSVPGEYATIQGAVDAAAEGDMVLVAPGVYVEAVDVETDRLTIRGADRDTVILDGELELDNGIRVLGASGVVVENLTAMNYTNNGVFWIQATGYRASYVTTYRTGDYGIYAFDSVQGQIDHAHTVGSRDAGIYIGQCYPCDALVTDVISANNGIGFSGTNAGGNLVIVNSDWYNNRVGIVPNSGSYELCYPQRSTTIIGNRVWANNQPDTPAIATALLAQGNGILVAGGIANTIERNRVDDHDRTGIGLVPYLEEFPNDDLPTEEEWLLSCDEFRLLPTAIPDDALLWDSYDNVVRDNVVSNSREADLAIASAGGDISTFRNCWSGNEFTTSAPLELQNLAPCDGAGAGDWTAGDLNVARWIGEQAGLPDEVDWREAPLPALGPHDNMDDPDTAPARPAVDVPSTIDLDAITTPELG